MDFSSFHNSLAEGRGVLGRPTQEQSKADTPKVLDLRSRSFQGCLHSAQMLQICFCASAEGGTRTFSPWERGELAGGKAKAKPAEGNIPGEQAFSPPMANATFVLPGWPPHPSDLSVGRPCKLRCFPLLGRGVWLSSGGNPLLEKVGNL